jgi:hypothetical protein
MIFVSALESVIKSLNLAAVLLLGPTLDNSFDREKILAKVERDHYRYVVAATSSSKIVRSVV